MDTSTFDCVICQDKLNDAHETLCCHQCYCKKCITDWMGRNNNNNSTCPSCRKAITEKSIAQNVPMQRLVDNLPADCPNFQKGCRDKLTRGGVADHLNVSCEYTVVICVNKCGKKMERHYTSHHIANSCSKRVVPCRHCLSNFKAEDLADHQNNKCLKIPRICPHCKGIITLENANEHYKNACPTIPIKCSFNKFGCVFQGKRADYHNHLIHSADEHVAQAERFFTQQNALKVAAVKAAPPPAQPKGRGRSRRS